MIKKILIANRGEIVLRIIRTCKELGIKTAVLCPQPGQEQNFLETGLADEYYFLNREGARGYLDQKRIVEIAKEARADAIHPGYGFLAENWKFAKLCKKKRIKFIGPHFKTLKKLEDKITAKKIAEKIGIPILPSSEGSIRNKNDLFKWVFKIKPPFVLKARRGGGGIGIRVVNSKISFGEVFSLALGVRKQMSTAFSDAEFFLEKYLPEARHIEFQVLGDGKKFIHLGERECSIQRRFQKLLEEAPSPFFNEEDRKKMGALAVQMVQQLRYQGAATVEFLVDKDKTFYFLEVNPRIQVEHPITEAITGIDIVEQQIRIAQGEEISFSQDDVVLNGWAMEARINAEDPQKNFQPMPGTIEKYHSPGGQGVFIHTFLKEGQEIYPYFDSLLAKLISWGKTRQEAVSKLKRALDEIIIEGVSTTVPFFQVLLKNEKFLAGDFTTNFIEESGILSKILFKKHPQNGVVVKKVPEELKEEDIAEIIFQIYQKLKDIRQSPEQDEPVSKWQMVERLKMFE